ncbi:hypothetical protein [Cellulomonas endophytica]|uniref:hypothetical protein n=1 Tax=Cellulomonas endophytica TaxID=2494735 RepID=UPI0010136267|nr:hypothetical protein [Cellulomonas endophytica]
MPSGEELPEVLPSAPDDDYECVRVDPGAAAAPDPGEPREGLCPPGYVPRRKGGAPYRLAGKRAVTDGPPEPNPAHERERGSGDAWG